MLKEKIIAQLNSLPVEVKLPIARALELIAKTQELMHTRWGDYDMSAQFALKDGIRDLENTMKKLAKGKVSDSLIHELELNTTKLITLSENILHWKFEE